MSYIRILCSDFHSFWEIALEEADGVACRLTGFPDSAREAALKRVRALQGAAWLTDPARFQALATATLALCQLYVTAASAGNASQR